mmetsp:Transcript_6117/g.16623  ORF Transcript_6117/g.16623 Transcript_6117/m.16623 type:complete len:227 (+) Transcript_6117:680-1360(+)
MRMRSQKRPRFRVPSMSISTDFCRATWTSPMTSLPRLRTFAITTVKASTLSRWSPLCGRGTMHSLRPPAPHVRSTTRRRGCCGGSRLSSAVRATPHSPQLRGLAMWSCASCCSATARTPARRMATARPRSRRPHTAATSGRARRCWPGPPRRAPTPRRLLLRRPWASRRSSCCSADTSTASLMPEAGRLDLAPALCSNIRLGSSQVRWAPNRTFLSVSALCRSAYL